MDNPEFQIRIDSQPSLALIPAMIARPFSFSRSRASTCLERFTIGLHASRGRGGTTPPDPPLCKGGTNPPRRRRRLFRSLQGGARGVSGVRNPRVSRSNRRVVRDLGVGWGDRG